jgi:hypothetical protein
VDDCTFWYANEYLTQTGPPPVHTRIASFKFPTCTTASSIQFASFTGKLHVRLSTGRFDLNSRFTLGTGSNGVNPVAEDVTLQIGPYSVTIPAGSFKQKKKGASLFAGTIDGAAVHFRIKPVGGNSYTLKAKGSGADLSGVSNPVTITLTIGDDTGSTHITAGIR